MGADEFQVPPGGLPVLQMFILRNVILSASVILTGVIRTLKAEFQPPFTGTVLDPAIPAHKEGFFRLAAPAGDLLG